MGGPTEALTALCNGEIRGRPCCQSWLVCLSERHYGDRQPALHVEQGLLTPDSFRDAILSAFSGFPDFSSVQSENK